MLFAMVAIGPEDFSSNAFIVGGGFLWIWRCLCIGNAKTRLFSSRICVPMCVILVIGKPVVGIRCNVSNMFIEVYV